MRAAVIVLFALLVLLHPVGVLLVLAAELVALAVGLDWFTGKVVAGSRHLKPHSEEALVEARYAARLP